MPTDNAQSPKQAQDTVEEGGQKTLTEVAQELREEMRAMRGKPQILHERTQTLPEWVMLRKGFAVRLSEVIAIKTSKLYANRAKDRIESSNSAVLVGTKWLKVDTEFEETLVEILRGICPSPDATTKESQLK